MKHDGIEQLYQTHVKEIYLYALALCEDHHIAEDLTSDTFYKALLSLDVKSSSIKYWLLHVCKNLFIDWCRKKRREPAPLSQDIAYSGNVPLNEIIKNEMRRDLYAALLRLSETDREMLTMFYFLDCGIVQIASHLGRTPGAVKTGLSRARVRLKKLLEEEKDE